MSHQDFTVVGAGIIGLCSALFLQESGFRVTLVDREGAGTGCSKGNAGHFATEQVWPLSSFSLLKQVPGMLLDPLGPVRLDWRYLPRILPWLGRFAMQAFPSRIQHNAQALAALNSASLPSYQTLFETLNMPSAVQMSGSLLVFESPALLQRFQATLPATRSLGVKIDILSSEQLYQLEPNLKPGLVGAAFFPETGHTIEPYQLCQDLYQRFLQRGGQFMRLQVEDIRPCNGAFELIGNGQRHHTQRLLLATGAWSKPLVEKLTHCRVPLDTERGYHIMLEKDGHQLSRPVSSADRKFIMTPMSGGLRLAGTVEFAGLHKAPTDSRARHLLHHARAMLPVSNAVGDSWMGFRPSLPDSLPVIERSEQHSNLYLAFGHQHLGLTQAAITGKLISELASQARPSLPIHPYRLNRF